MVTLERLRAQLLGPGLGPRGLWCFAQERWGTAQLHRKEIGSQSFNPMKVTPAICGCFRKRKRKNVEAAQQMAWAGRG